jgi:hypothetical protein
VIDGEAVTAESSSPPISAPSRITSSSPTSGSSSETSTSRWWSGDDAEQRTGAAITRETTGAAVQPAVE